MQEDLSSHQVVNLPADRSLLIVEDDKAHAQRLMRAMEARDFVVRSAGSAAEAMSLIHDSPPAFAVVDLRLGDGHGLEVLAELLRVRPTARVIVFTGYDSLTTAVLAIKFGAVNYLAKPADADDVCKALLASPTPNAPGQKNFMTADRVRWEHIQRVYELCNRNVSETARRLAMHRRTLQHILTKRAPK